jgi:hypothetical protein
MKPRLRFAACILLVTLILSACAAPAPTATRTQPPPPTETPAPTELATSEPSATPGQTLLDLEVLEWSEFPYAHPADPSNTDTHVEVLIRNPNDVPVRVLRDGVELRFLNASGQVVYANPNPFLYLWQGEWLTPGQTTGLSACVCFQSQGLEKQAWVSLELVAPLEITHPAYTLDVEVTMGEMFSLAEAHLGGSGLGAEMTLINTSDQVLESISKLVLARDAGGRYVGMAMFGNAVVSIREQIGIQPGDTGTGVNVNDIDYFDGPMTYEIQAIGIIAAPAPAAEPASAGAPLTEWRGIPIMPGALTGGEADGGYQFSTRAAIDEITQFYETALAGLGYALTTSGEQSGVVFLLFQKGSATAAVGILPSGEFNQVQITVTP